MASKLAQNKLELHELQVMKANGEITGPEVDSRIRLLERLIELQECDSVDEFSRKLTAPHVTR